MDKYLEEYLRNVKGN